MNSDNHHSCCCCCRETREQPRPQNTCSVPYYDPTIVPDCICGRKACSIFGTHDYYPPSITCAPAKKKREKCNTLGSPIGLVISTNTVKVPDSMQLRYAICLKAFARVFISPEREWTTAVIDQLLKEGQQLIAESQKFDATGDGYSPPDIYSDIEGKVKRSFQLAGCSFTVELSEKYRGLKMDKEIIGDDIMADLVLELFKTSLKHFFAISKYCLVRISSLYFMTWKSRGVYFVFDCNGRRQTDLITDREKGFGMLICLKSLSNVCHLIKNLSELNKEDTFSLRELKVVKLVGADGKVQNRDFGKRTNQYEIVNSDFALLRAQLHLTLNKADVMRSCSALPASVATLLASKIDHPATWNQKMLDKIICFGFNVCKTGWSHCRSCGDPIQANLIPTQLTIGQFIACYLITGPIYKGIWRCVPNYVDTELSKALTEIIESNAKNFIIQFNQQFYAVWKKNNFIYFMDVYRHLLQIPVGDNEDHKSAALRMFRTIDMFLQVFHIVILESNKTTSFYIYKVQIKKLNLVDPCEVVPPCMPEDDDEEVKSLNETICFEEDETKCTAELGEISDYEDEDLLFGRGDLRREPLSESDESEEDMEEEEMGLEDFGEYESSSSGDGGHGHGRRGKRGKGKTKNERDRQLQKSNKGKRGGKKGKGAKDDVERYKKGKKERKGKKTLKERLEDKLKGKKSKKDKETKEKKAKEKKTKEKKTKEKKQKDKTEEEKNKKKKKDTTGKQNKGKNEKEKKEKESKENKEKDKGKKESKDKKGKDKDEKDTDKEKGKELEKKDKKKKKDGDESDDDDPSKKKAKKDKKGKKDDESDEETEPRKKVGKKRKMDRPEESDSEPDTSKPKKTKVSKDKDVEDEKNKVDKGPGDKNVKKEIKSERSSKDSKSIKDDEKLLARTLDPTVSDPNSKLNKSFDGKSQYTTRDIKNQYDSKADKDSHGKWVHKQFGDERDEMDDRYPNRSRHQGEGEDDEDEDYRDIVGCKANNYPGYSTVPRDMAVVGSESGSYESICKLLRAGFKCADRILTMTPWGNYVVFRGYDASQKIYFLFDGCTCNVNRFRHLDLNCGTAGLLCYKNLHDVICYILDSHKIRTNLKMRRKNIVDEICKQYCN